MASIQCSAVSVFTKETDSPSWTTTIRVANPVAAAYGPATIGTAAAPAPAGALPSASNIPPTSSTASRRRSSAHASHRVRALVRIRALDPADPFDERLRRRWVTGRATASRVTVLGRAGNPALVVANHVRSRLEALALLGGVAAYIALLVELGDRKFISLAQYKTNRDYVNALRGIPQLHSRMRGLTDSFERHWYGFAQATENDWQEFRTGYLAARQTGSH